MSCQLEVQLHIVDMRTGKLLYNVQEFRGDVTLDDSGLVSQSGRYSKPWNSLSELLFLV